MTTTTAAAATNTATNTATATINSSLASVANNYQTFLSLLTTQLKNQDPLSPLDTNQFTQQLTQMTGVEQQLLSNQLLQQLVTAQAGIGQNANLIGKMITAPGANTGDADITGVVSAIQQVDGATVLTVGSNQVPLSSVTKIASDPNNPFAALGG
ncbi:MAG: hypothetical protein JSR86_10725 [Proteobacteria bacterium]|nr:hypothetical protein [Pseudomonadota bacterium]